MNKIDLNLGYGPIRLFCISWVPTLLSSFTGDFSTHFHDNSFALGARGGKLHIFKISTFQEDEKNKNSVSHIGLN